MKTDAQIQQDVLAELKWEPSVNAAEVRQHSGLVDQLRDLARKGHVTLVYSAHDEAHNDAVVLRSLVLD